MNTITIENLLDELLKREGGYVNDPDDKGGATKYGITQATLSHFRQSQGRAAANIRDVQNLTQSEARLIYEQNYFYKPKINKLPHPLIPSVFDMYVNAGKHAIKILQKTLCEFGHEIAVDGIIGEETCQAAFDIWQRAGQYLIDAYGIERRNYYYGLADNRPASRKYARTRAGKKGGWIKRAEEFISPRFWLSEGEHQNRTAIWGA